MIGTVGKLKQKRKQLPNCGEADEREQSRIMMLRVYCQSQTAELEGKTFVRESRAMKLQRLLSSVQDRQEDH